MGFEPSIQHGASGKTMRVEIGHGDYTILTAMDDTESGPNSHAVATNLTYVAGGWVFCWSAANSACSITTGCISSQMVSHDHTWGSGYIDFTMESDASGEGGGDTYILFGW